MNPASHPPTPLRAESAVRVRGLEVVLGGAEVVRGVDLDLPFGRTTVVVGPNGAGKSTLLRAIVGAVPSTGSVRVLDAPLAQVRRHVAYVAQDSADAAELPVTALEVVRMGRYPHRGWWRRFRREDHDAVERAMADAGVEPFADRALYELSGGQRRRVAVARALAQEARVVLLDEPFAAVDATTARDLLGTLQRIGRDPARCVALVHHDLDTARACFDQGIVLGGSGQHEGRVVAAGRADEALSADSLAQAYGIAVGAGGLHPGAGPDGDDGAGTTVADGRSR